MVCARYLGTADTGVKENKKISRSKDRIFRFLLLLLRGQIEARFKGI